MSKGAVSAEMVQQAFIDATSAGGKFYGMSENASKTINGQISMMQDAWDNAFNEIGTKSEGVIMSGIKATTSLIQNYETVGKVLVGLIATYGAYRTAIMLVTAAESKHTLIEIRLTNVRVLARKAQQALNASMLTNPYVLLATVIAGLVATVWTLRDSTSAAEKVQKQLNEEHEKAIQKKQELTSKTESLIAKINDETESVYNQIKAYKELVKLFPELKGITFEEFKAMPQFQKKTMLNNFVDKRELDDAIRLYEKDLEIIKALKKRIDDAIYSPYNKSDGSVIKEVENLRKQLEYTQKLASAHKAQLDEIKKQQWEANTPVEKKIEYYQQLLASLQSEYDELNRQINPSKLLADTTENMANSWLKMPDLIGKIRLDNLNKQIDETTGKINSLTGKGNGSALTVTLDKAYWEKIKKEAETALAGLDVSEFNSVKWKEYTKTIQDAQKEIDKYTTSGRKKESDTRQQTEKKMHDDLLSLRRQNQQAEIDLMTEGAEKRLAQIELNYDNEIAAILAKEKEWKAAQAGKLTSEQTVEIHLGLTNSWLKKEKLTTSVYKEQAEAEKQAMKELLDKYQDYAAQRTEIEKNFNAEIATLEKGRTTDNSAEIDRAIAEIKKRQKEALSRINLSELQEDIDWSNVFGNLDKVSTETLSNLKDKLKTYLKDAAGSISKDDFKTVTDALDQMDQALADRKPFDGLKEGFNEYKLACQNVAASQKTVNDLVKQGDTSSSAYKKALANLTQAQDKRRNSLVKMSQAANQIGEKGGEMVQAGNNIVGMLTDLGIEVPETTGKVLDGMGQIMSGLANIDLTKPLSILTSATSIIGGIGKTIGGIFGFSSKKTVPQEMIDSYGDLMEILDDVISKQKEFLDNMAGTGAVSQYKKVQDLIDKQVEATMRLGKARLAAGSSAGSHSYGVRARRALEPYKKELKEIGVDLDKMDGRVTQLFELDPETLRQFQTEYSDIWLKIDADAREYLETLIRLGDDTKDLAEQTNEALTGISFDSARSELKNFLLDTDATMADVAENFEDYMRQAIVNTIIDDTMQNQIRSWYDQFTAAMDEKKDANGNLIEKAGILTEKEKEDLQNLYNQIFQDAANMRDNAYEAAGIEDKKDSTRQSSAKSIAASITQDSADALNGNFNAQLIYSNKTAEGVTSLKEQLSYIYQLQLHGWQDVRAIRDLTDKVNQNTRQVAEITERIADLSEDIRSNTSRTAEAVGDIKLKGIYIKR